MRKDYNEEIKDKLKDLFKSFDGDIEVEIKKKNVEKEVEDPCSSCDGKDCECEECDGCENCLAYQLIFENGDCDPDGYTTTTPNGLRDTIIGSILTTLAVVGGVAVVGGILSSIFGRNK